MATTVAFSPELIVWARRTCWDFASSNGVAAATFWSAPDGETRYDVRPGPSGWFEVARTGRYGEPHVEFLASGIGVVERYFWGEFGKDVRGSFELPRLKFPRNEQDVAPGYSMSRQDEKLDLIDPRQNVIARSESGVIEVMRFAQLSHLLSSSLEDIKASFLSSEGSPLFVSFSR